MGKQINLHRLIYDTRKAESLTCVYGVWMQAYTMEIQILKELNHR